MSIMWNLTEPNMELIFVPLKHLLFCSLERHLTSSDYLLQFDFSNCGFFFEKLAGYGTIAGNRAFQNAPIANIPFANGMFANGDYSCL